MTQLPRPISPAADRPVPAPSTPFTDRPVVRNRNQRRLPIVIAMISSLVLSGGVRYLSAVAREKVLPHYSTGSAAGGLGSMNSFALALLLGGLRGPLVMFLWSQSENAKSDNNLEGLDTQIEWIRLLQPEFDTVHIFQIWNKAYNLSVKMASRANKYEVILGALRYAADVDRSKPEDINIVSAIGQLHFDKFGNSSEKFYYRKRVREESFPHPRLDNKHDTVVDASGFVLPDLYRPSPEDGPRPAGLDPSAEWDTGAKLQYVPTFAPYLDGVSPYALAYNYYKRAEVLQSLRKQHHDQLGDVVVDSRPGLSLEFWSYEENDQARRREFEAFNLPYPEGANDDNVVQDAMQMATAEITPRYPIANRRAAELAVFDYDKATVVAAAGDAEFVRHILNHPEQESLYLGHRQEMGTKADLCAGDRDFLEAMLDPGRRAALTASAAKSYQSAIDSSSKIILRSYIDPRVVTPMLPPGFAVMPTGTEKSVFDLSTEQVAEVMRKEKADRDTGKPRRDNSDRLDFDRIIGRARTRLQGIKSVVDPAATQPSGR